MIQLVIYNDLQPNSQSNSSYVNISSSNIYNQPEQYVARVKREQQNNEDRLKDSDEHQKLRDASVLV